MERALSVNGLLTPRYSFAWLCAKDPKQEYKRESFSMFANMLEALKYEVISTLSKVQVRLPEEVEALEQQRREEAERLAKRQQLSHEAGAESLMTETEAKLQQGHKIGRNDPCPCGSGKNTSNAMAV